MNKTRTIQRACIAFFFALTGLTMSAYAQDEWTEGGGQIEAVEIEIVKEREITLPKANRNFEKIPPRPSEPIKPPITYDFRSFTFQTPEINPVVRPLKLKQEQPTGVAGGYLTAGYGNYSSPYFDAFINSGKDKNKLVGARIFHRSAGRGPVDGRNSATGQSTISLFGKSFTEHLSLSGDVAYDNRVTHFYGYLPGTEVNRTDIRQTFNTFSLNGELANARNSDFSYSLGAGFSYMADRFDAEETEVDLKFKSAYRLNEDSRIKIAADYTVLSRKDALIDGKIRNLFQVRPAYEFLIMDEMRVRIGAVGSFEDDTLGSKNVHVYPDLSALYPISPSVDFTASLTGGIERVSLHSITRENMWVASNIPLFHTNKLFDFQAGINARIGNKVATNAGLSLAALRNWYFYRNVDGDPSRFTLEYDDGTTRRSNLYGSISYAQTERFKFMMRGDYFVYGTDRVQEAWHRPTYKFTGNVFYNLFDKFLFNVDMIGQGGMKAFDTVNDAVVTVDAAFDLNLKTEYLFSDSFSLFVQFNNITNNQYPIFFNYPVRGLQFMGGLTWSF